MKNTFLGRNPPKTHHIMLRLWSSGGRVNMYAIFPPELADNMRVSGLALQPDGVWKSFELRSDFGTESMELWSPSQQSSCHPSPKPESDGSHDQRRLNYWAQRAVPNIFDGSFWSVSTPEPVPGPFFDSDGTKST